MIFPSFSDKARTTPSSHPFFARIALGIFICPFALIFTISIYKPLPIKKCASRSRARKTQTPIAATQNSTNIGKIHAIRPVEFAFLPNPLWTNVRKNKTPLKKQRAFSDVLYKVLCCKAIITYNRPLRQVQNAENFKTSTPNFNNEALLDKKQPFPYNKCKEENKALKGYRHDRYRKQKRMLF